MCPQIAPTVFGLRKTAFLQKHHKSCAFCETYNFFKIHIQLDAILRKEGSYKKTKEKSCTIAKVQENIFLSKKIFFQIIWYGRRGQSSAPYKHYLIWDTGLKFSPVKPLFSMADGAKDQPRRASI